LPPARAETASQFRWAPARLENLSHYPKRAIAGTPPPVGATSKPGLPRRAALHSKLLPEQRDRSALSFPAVDPYGVLLLAAWRHNGTGFRKSPITGAALGSGITAARPVGTMRATRCAPVAMLRTSAPRRAPVPPGPLRKALPGIVRSPRVECEWRQ